MRTVRAVSDGDKKYVGFCPSGKRRINGEVFEWPDGRGMPEVVRDADGNIVSGWVELVSGTDGGAPTKPKGRNKAKIPGLVERKDDKRYAASGNDLTASGRASDRVIG